MTHRPAKLAKLEAVAQMRREGLACRKIGAALGVSRPAVCRLAWEARKARLDTGPERRSTAKLAEMPIESHTQQELAGILGVTRSAVTIALGKLGRRAKPSRKGSPKRSPTVAALRSMVVEDHTVAELSAMLGVTRGTITNCLRKIGRRAKSATGVPEHLLGDYRVYRAKNYSAAEARAALGIGS